MGVRRGGARGDTCPPPPYVVVLQNTQKFSLTPTAFAIDTPYFNLKRCDKKKRNFVCAFGSPKYGRFLYGVLKLFKVSVVCPSGKISADAHAGVNMKG